MDNLSKWYTMWKAVLAVLNVLHKILHVIPGVKSLPLKIEQTAQRVQEKIDVQKDKRYS